MYKNCLRYAFLTGMMFFSLFAMSQPPYMIEKVISGNKIVNLNNQKLLIIDFWATWCVPCAPATKQLEILQELKPDDVFIVAVSEENEKTIAAYLKKNPIKLAVLKDYMPNSMLELFAVQSRPYSILLSVDGNILHEGHPSSITAKMIEKYAQQMKSVPKKEWQDLFYTVQNNTTPKTFSKKELVIVKQPHAEKRMYTDNGIFYYSGPLSELIKYLTDCSKYQIEFNGMADYSVSMSCNELELLNLKSIVLQQVKKRLSLNIQIGCKKMDAYLLEVENSRRLWDNKQINWGNSINPPYIVGTDRVEADNITLKALANLLSEIKGNLYYYTGNDENRYDWSFHYNYDDLMIEDLEDSFGIKLKKEKVTIPIYTISPK